MDIEEQIDPELLEPWMETDVEYPMFQEAVWVNQETAHVLAVEKQRGPYGGSPPWYYIALLESVDTTEIEEYVEKRLKTAEEAVHEAHALMAMGEVLD